MAKWRLDSANAHLPTSKTLCVAYRKQPVVCNIFYDDKTDRKGQHCVQHGASPVCGFGKIMKLVVSREYRLMDAGDYRQ